MTCVECGAHVDEPIYWKQSSPPVQEDRFWPSAGKVIPVWVCVFVEGIDESLCSAACSVARHKPSG